MNNSKSLNTSQSTTLDFLFESNHFMREDCDPHFKRHIIIKMCFRDFEYSNRKNNLRNDLVIIGSCQINCLGRGGGGEYCKV